MNSFPQKNSVLILDNASIHKSFQFYELMAITGIKIEFLPAYSPDFNPVSPVKYLYILV